MKNIWEWIGKITVLVVVAYAVGSGIARDFVFVPVVFAKIDVIGLLTPLVAGVTALFIWKQLQRAQEQLTIARKESRENSISRAWETLGKAQEMAREVEKNKKGKRRQAINGSSTFQVDLRSSQDNASRPFRAALVRGAQPPS